MICGFSPIVMASWRIQKDWASILFESSSCADFVVVSIRCVAFPLSDNVRMFNPLAWKFSSLIFPMNLIHQLWEYQVVQYEFQAESTKTRPFPVINSRFIFGDVPPKKDKFVFFLGFSMKYYKSTIQLFGCPHDYGKPKQKISPRCRSHRSRPKPSGSDLLSHWPWEIFFGLPGLVNQQFAMENGTFIVNFPMKNGKWHMSSEFSHE